MLVYVRRDGKETPFASEKLQSIIPPDRALKVVRSLNQLHDEKCDEYYKKSVLRKHFLGMNVLTEWQRKRRDCAL